MEAKNWIMIIAVALIIAVVFSIFYFKDEEVDEATINCVAENSILYVSKTCSHCAEQKRILGDNLDKFTLIDCQDESEKCALSEIYAVPTWDIKGEKYVGVKSLNELKEISGCGV